MSELLGESLDIQSGERALDVACGNGNPPAAAARLDASSSPRPEVHTDE